MKRHTWTIVNNRTGERVGWSTSTPSPVDADHVINSPSVKQWANGDPIRVLPQSYSQDEPDIVADSYETIPFDRFLDAIKSKFGDDCDPSKVQIEIAYKQYKSFGYDLYDADDYRIEIKFSYGTSV